MEYEIRKLTIEDKDEIVRIISSQPKMQLTQKLGTYRSNLLVAIISRLQHGSVNNFGAFVDNKLVAFLDTNRWETDFQNWSLGLGSVDKLIELPRSKNSRWPEVIIKLVNHAVKFYEAEKRNVAWGVRTTDKKWVTYDNEPECLLKDYKKEIVQKIPAWTNLIEAYEGKYMYVSIGMLPSENNIWKMTNPNIEPFELPKDVKHKNLKPVGKKEEITEWKDYKGHGKEFLDYNEE